ncbi:hypothetical protein XENOCAPTIV_027312 [Xenoophorus captivus]|uniref:Uncharacterized protein n=1 Tax=Xenoophorus captivus TaxID=1517983 RepID=A0ABV0QTP2_9TELE
MLISPSCLHFGPTSNPQSMILDFLVLFLASRSDLGLNLLGLHLLGKLAAFPGGRFSVLNPDMATKYGLCASEGIMTRKLHSIQKAAWGVSDGGLVSVFKDSFFC